MNEGNQEKVKNSTLQLGIFAVALMALAAVYVSGTGAETPQPPDIPDISEETPDSFSDVEILGKTAVVFDTVTGEVYFDKEKDRRMPLASLTKIFSTDVLEENIQNITVSSDAIAQEGDEGLLTSEVWNARELLSFALVTSSNDAMTAGRETFERRGDDLVSHMNEKVVSLGLTNTLFFNETGLDPNGHMSGGYGSAYDVAKMLAHVYEDEENYELFKHTKKEKASFSALNYEGEHTGENTNEIAEKIPGLLLSKTGFTDIAGGNLAILFEKEPQHPIAVVVLGSTKEARFSDVEKLVWAAISYEN